MIYYLYDFYFSHYYMIHINNNRKYSFRLLQVTSM